MPDVEQAAMERLSFAESQPHEAIEGAIHLGRYVLARRFCPGKKVLDVACGEGYGSFFMARRWGAREVHAVDISGEAIDRARRIFGGDGIVFHQAGVERLDALFGEGEFDAAVSLETIEHLNDPAMFLRSLRRVVRPGGPIVITCPNDHWYYRTAEERNPFHVRKFTFEEFRAIAEAELGPARRWALGTPVSGFVNVDVGSALLGRAGAPRSALLDARDDVDAVIVPTEEAVLDANCSYFVGVWGDAAGEGSVAAGALYACSMDSSASAHRQADVSALRDDVVALRTQLFEARKAEARAAELATELVRVGRESASLREGLALLEQRSAGTVRENASLREDVSRLEEAAAEAQRALRDEVARGQREIEEARRISGEHAAAAERSERERGHAQLRLHAAAAEIELLRERAGSIRDLRQTIADQARLVDERDAYIKVLEARVDEGQRIRTELEARVARIRGNPLFRAASRARRAALRLVGR